MKQQLPEAENQCIFKGAPELRILKHGLKVRKPNPGAVPQSRVVLVILKSQGNSSHGQITENHVPQKHRKQHGIKHPVIFQMLPEIPSWLRGRLFFSFHPFSHLAIVFCLSVIIIEKYRPNKYGQIRGVPVSKNG